jgi:hypothetical protein
MRMITSLLHVATVMYIVFVTLLAVLPGLVETHLSAYVRTYQMIAIYSPNLCVRLRVPVSQRTSLGLLLQRCVGGVNGRR